MTCAQCGTEIAANALICYRCGRPTVESSEAPRKTRGTGGRGAWVSAIAAVILVVAALFMGQSTFGEVPRELSWTLAGLAAIVLAWRLWKRGR